MYLIIISSSATFTALLYNTPLWRLLSLLLTSLVMFACADCLKLGALPFALATAKFPHEINWSRTEFRGAADSGAIGSPSSNRLEVLLDEFTWVLSAESTNAVDGGDEPW